MQYNVRYRNRIRKPLNINRSQKDTSDKGGVLSAWRKGYLNGGTPQEWVEYGRTLALAVGKAPPPGAG